MATLPITNPDVASTRHGGLCQFLNMKEENIRFVLLAVLLFLYLALGAFVFQAVEESAEKKIRDDFVTLYNQFVHNLTGLHSMTGFGEPTTDGQTTDLVLSDGSFVNSSFSGNISGALNGSGGSSSGGMFAEMWNGKLTSSSFESVDYPGAGGGREPPSIDKLHELLFAYGNATQAGVIWKRRRWDYVGSFHFTWTIVSTIGYGATSPTTTLGKLLIIPYGFFGCAGGLLFFNLFLERIITFLATCMRLYRLQRQKRRPYIYSGGVTTTTSPPPTTPTGVWTSSPTTTTATSPPPKKSTSTPASHRNTSPARSSTGEGSVIDDPSWKPSVYWVMLCLFIMSAFIIFGSATMFQHMENWTFSDAIYFSFVSYATIGFGDLVSLQQKYYGTWELLYRISAFAVMIFGCCCIYSLLNVTSIVIKQVLNWLIQRMHYCDCCCAYCQCSAKTMRRRLSRRSRRRRRKRGGDREANLGIAVLKVGNNRKIRTFSEGGEEEGEVMGGSPGGRRKGGRGRYCGGVYIDMDERRCSGENMISIRGELSNKVSLAVMQKRLYETAQMSRQMGGGGETFSASTVGPLAIVTEKLGDNHG